MRSGALISLGAVAGFAFVVIGAMVLGILDGLQERALWSSAHDHAQAGSADQTNWHTALAEHDQAFAHVAHARSGYVSVLALWLTLPGAGGLTLASARKRGARRVPAAFALVGATLTSIVLTLLCFRTGYLSPIRGGLPIPPAALQNQLRFCVLHWIVFPGGVLLSVAATLWIHLSLLRCTQEE